MWQIKTCVQKKQNNKIYSSQLRNIEENEVYNVIVVRA